MREREERKGEVVAWLTFCKNIWNTHLWNNHFLSSLTHSLLFFLKFYVLLFVLHVYPSTNEHGKSWKEVTTKAHDILISFLSLSSNILLFRSQKDSDASKIVLVAKYYEWVYKIMTILFYYYVYIFLKIIFLSLTHEFSLIHSLLLTLVYRCSVYLERNKYNRIEKFFLSLSSYIFLSFNDVRIECFSKIFNLSSLAENNFVYDSYNYDNVFKVKFLYRSKVNF